jgi:hypothetical protein
MSDTSSTLQLHLPKCRLDVYGVVSPKVTKASTLNAAVIDLKEYK